MVLDAVLTLPTPVLTSLLQAGSSAPFTWKALEFGGLKQAATVQAPSSVNAAGACNETFSFEISNCVTLRALDFVIASEVIMKVEYCDGFTCWQGSG